MYMLVLKVYISVCSPVCIHFWQRIEQNLLGLELYLIPG